MAHKWQYTMQQRQVSFHHCYPAPVCLQEQAAMLQKKNKNKNTMVLQGTWMDAQISSTRVVLPELNMLSSLLSSHRGMKAKGTGAKQLCGACSCFTGLHERLGGGRGGILRCEETTEKLCLCCWQTVLVNFARPGRGFLLGWIPGSNFLSRKNRLAPGRAEMLQLQLHVVFAFLFPSYLQHLKIRTATEAHACKGVILSLLLLFKS